jgi:hypothetical protein
MAGRSSFNDSGPAESEAKWQKHVVAALWVFLALLIVLCVALVYGKANGLFHPMPGETTPPWPVEWP